MVVVRGGPQLVARRWRQGSGLRCRQHAKTVPHCVGGQHEQHAHPPALQGLFFMLLHINTVLK